MWALEFEYINFNGTTTQQKAIVTSVIALLLLSRACLSAWPLTGHLASCDVGVLHTST
jgi:hypothetical protein